TARIRRFAAASDINGKRVATLDRHGECKERCCGTAASSSPIIGLATTCIARSASTSTLSTTTDPSKDQLLRPCDAAHNAKRRRCCCAKNRATRPTQTTISPANQKGRDAGS